MQGQLLIVLFVQTCLISDTCGAHCPMANQETSVVAFCSGKEVFNSKVSIDGTGAEKLRNQVQIACSCDIRLQDTSTSNRIYVTYQDGNSTCGSRIEIQAKSGAKTDYACDFKGPYTSEELEFTVTFRKLSNEFSTEYCLLIVPDDQNSLRSAKATVRCTSLDKTSSTVETTPKENKARTLVISSSVTPTRSLIATSSAIEIADDENQGEDNIVPIAVGAGVGGVVFIVIITVVSIMFCRRKTRKSSTLTKPSNVNDDIEMTENALYNLPVGDDNTTSSTLEIRHIEVAGGDVYALPCKRNSAYQPQYRGTLQEGYMYSTPPGTIYDGKNTEQERNDQINQASVSYDGINNETVKSYHYAEPEDGIETPQTSVDPTYSEVCSPDTSTGNSLLIK